VDVTANSLHPGAIVTNLFRHSNIINGTHFNESHNFHVIFSIIGLKIGHSLWIISMKACSDCKVWWNCIITFNEFHILFQSYGCFMFDSLEKHGHTWKKHLRHNFRNHAAVPPSFHVLPFPLFLKPLLLKRFLLFGTNC
jgi:hypothetical protein